MAVSCCPTLCLKGLNCNNLLYFICPRYSEEAAFVKQSDSGLTMFLIMWLDSVVPDQAVVVFMRTFYIFLCAEASVYLSRGTHA